MLHKLKNINNKRSRIDGETILLMKRVNRIVRPKLKMTNFAITYETNFYCVINSLLLEAM